ncbi:MAG: mechanosensitive ion channel [Bacteroidales bacterium]|nr:mechanosensitive ion channel [Bacteroidales bacterium]
MNVDNILNTCTNLVLEYGPKLLLAIIVLFVGKWLIKKIGKLVAKTMGKRNVDESLRSFLASLLNGLLWALLIISVLTMVGVETTSFVAILGAAGLAVGMALQGSLSNFAGGVLILFNKPFKVGDLIDAQGFTGVVKDIQIFTTTLSTVQGNTIIIPNGPLSNGNIVNHTVNGQNRVDVTFGIDYAADIETARKALIEVAKKAPNALQDPAPSVAVSSLGDSSVNLTLCTYCNPSDYWGIFFYNNEYGKIALDKAGINIPFPQMDVHMKN